MKKRKKKKLQTYIGRRVEWKGSHAAQDRFIGDLTGTVVGCVLLIEVDGIRALENISAERVKVLPRYPLS